jgi:hypothetical protein
MAANNHVLVFAAYVSSVRNDLYISITQTVVHQSTLNRALRFITLFTACIHLISAIDTFHWYVAQTTSVSVVNQCEINNISPWHWIYVKSWVKKTKFHFCKSNQFFTLIQRHHIYYYYLMKWNSVDSTSFCPMGRLALVIGSLIRDCVIPWLAG